MIFYNAFSTLIAGYKEKKQRKQENKAQQEGGNATNSANQQISAITPSSQGEGEAAGRGTIAIKLEDIGKSVTSDLNMCILGTGSWAFRLFMFLALF